jgi:hypothetical protein
MKLDVFYDYERKILVRTTSQILASKVLETAEYLFSVNGHNVSTYIDEQNYHSKNSLMSATDYLEYIKKDL